MVMFGAMADLPTVWAMADISMGMMAMINLTAIVLLSGTVVKLAQDYNKQLALGKIPTFNSQDYPELHAQLEAGIWEQPSSSSPSSTPSRLR
jgi:AGCS family alanine or glycine:cation symporter